MSDPNQPKAPPGPPAESPTKAFVLKMDGWLTDLMKQDLELDAAAPDEKPPEPIPPEAAPPRDDPDRRGG